MFPVVWEVQVNQVQQTFNIGFSRYRTNSISYRNWDRSIYLEFHIISDRLRSRYMQFVICFGEGIGFGSIALIYSLLCITNAMLIKTSAPIGAWKCNFLPLLEIMKGWTTNQQTEQPTDRQTGQVIGKKALTWTPLWLRRVHWRLTRPLEAFSTTSPASPPARHQRRHQRVTTIGSLATGRASSPINTNMTHVTNSVSSSEVTGYLVKAIK